MRSLSKKLSVVLQKVKDSFSHTNNICQHSEIIYNVQDIADLYGKLQKNERTFDQFGQVMNSYLETVNAYQLQNRLKKMILGQGALDTPGNDIYNSYKRQYVSDNGVGCSARYNEDIKNFRESLAYLDQALAEALLLHQKWLLEANDDSITPNQVNEISGLFETHSKIARRPTNNTGSFTAVARFTLKARMLLARMN